MELNIRPIAHIETDLPDKFGVPRQCSLAQHLTGRIIFEEEYRNPEAVRGLDEYDYIWLIWEFDRAKGGRAWSPTVRPPRLGGNTHMGVFATRSPFRPNHLGLSSVRLEKIEITSKYGPVIYVSGIDMSDQTPIYDIKPYVPYSDCHPEAASAFSSPGDAHILQVEADEQVWKNFPDNKREALLEVLSLDPRPSYHNDPQRSYGMSFAGYEVHFKVKENVLTVEQINHRKNEIT